ncbi:MAG: 16S rRNA (guanine(527)-N(7))-methyltransferase RsmG [Microscillaceae bacterium]
MLPTVELIFKYFPDLDETQKARFMQMGELYQDWNQRVNVVSRKDVELLYERHVLHSLSIARLLAFRPSAQVMDVGTGGGFPGLPLAILFPETNFLLVDSIAKKIKVVQDLAQGLGLHNVRALQARMEDIDETFDFIVNRAVAPLKTLLYWTRDKYRKDSYHSLPNGLISLKGGNLQEEIEEADRNDAQVFAIKDFFEEAFFETKQIVYVSQA